MYSCFWRGSIHDFLNCQNGTVFSELALIIYTLYRLRVLRPKFQEKTSEICETENHPNVFVQVYHPKILCSTQEGFYHFRG